MGAPWYTYPRIDGYGGPEPYGGLKHDSNVQVPDGTPITSLVPGVVTGINNVTAAGPIPGTGFPAWGSQITIRMQSPINALATHIAYLHLTGIPAGLRIGQTIGAGTLLGYSGGQLADGAQKAPVGVALYQGDAYGYGPTWNANALSPLLNPVPLLNMAQNGTLTIPGGSNIGGLFGGVQGLFSGGSTQTGGPTFGSVVTTTLAPNADLQMTLFLLDELLVVVNPFVVQNPVQDVIAIPSLGIPSTSIGPITVPGTPTIGGGSFSFTDPIMYIQDVAYQMALDFKSVVLRVLFFLLGLYILWKVSSRFIDFGALASGAGGVIKTAASGAVLAA